MERRYFSLLGIWACAVAGLLPVSCADEEVAESGEPVPARGVIGIRGAADGIAPVSDELMKSYKIVFVEKPSGLVRDVVEKNLSAPAERDAFDFQVGPGTYVVYAFGNMDTYYDGLGITENQPMPDLSAAVYDVENGFAGPMPMSCRQEVTVSGRANQNFSVELLRLQAGIRFVFSNYASEPLSVEEITLKPLTKDRVYLLQRLTEEGKPDLPAPADTVTYRHVLPAPLTLAVGADKVEGPTFHFNESVAAGVHETGLFALSFKVKRSGSDVEEDVRYALTGDGLTYINRNDFILQPVGFTDYFFLPEISFYPPIGGFPAAEIVQKSKEEFFCTFKTPGDFVVIPRLRRYDQPDGWISVSDTDRVKDFTIATTGDGEIFEREPQVESTGEIIGTLGDKSGTACVTMTVSLPEAGTSALRLLTCRVYIIKE